MTSSASVPRWPATPGLGSCSHTGWKSTRAETPSSAGSGFTANQGKIWLCGACTKPRGITEDQLAEGVSIVGAAKVVEEVVAGAKTIAFA